mgnify:CR=1 FL=1
MPRLLIFDMDDTLYTSNALRDMFHRAVYMCVADKTNLDLSEAKIHFNKTREQTEKTTGKLPGKTATLYLYYGISIKEFEKYKMKVLDGRDFPNLNTPEINWQLSALFKKVRLKFYTAVFTNNHKSLTNIILNKLGLENIFDRIYTLDDMGEELLHRVKHPDMPLEELDEQILSYIKPSKIRLEQIMKEFNLPAKDCVSIGDRYHIDLVYAEELGMDTEKVENVTDVLKFLRTLDL